jgi:hypothetical protein
MMTKSVLLAGALAGVILAIVWVMVPFYPVGSLQDKWGESLLGGLGPLVGIWMCALAAALVGDFLLRRQDRRAVQPFAEALAFDPRNADDDGISQSDNEGVEGTRTIGTVEDRPAEVTLSRSLASRGTGGPRLSVMVACDCPWSLDVRPRKLGTRLLSLAGAAVSTGYPEVDAALVVQADDALGIRDWLADGAVRDRVLSLFERHHLQALTLQSGPGDETVLRAELVPRLFGPPVQEPAGLTHALRALADTLEHRRP